MQYVQGFVTPVPEGNRDAYVEMARKGWALFSDFGALSMQENWGADVPEGQVTSFPMAVKLEPDEVVVFSWLIWPDKATADTCFATMETDPRWREMGEMCWDGKRMIFGGFSPAFTASA